MMARGSLGSLLVGLACSTLVGCTFTPSDGTSSSSGQSTRTGGAGLDEFELLATVNEREITAAELRDRILQRYYGRRALEGLIREELFRGEARRLGIEVTPEEVAARVEQEVAQMAEPSGGDVERLAADLESAGVSLGEHRRHLRLEFQNLLLIERVTLERRQRAGITEKAIRDEYARTFERPRVRVRHIAFPAEPSARGDEGAEATLTEARQRAEEVRSLLLAGEDFDRLARERSGDTATAERGGQLGWIAREDFRDQDLEAAIFALAEGEISKPVLQKEYGYHLFRVDEKSAARPLEEVREQVRERLLLVPPTPAEVKSTEGALRAKARIFIMMPDGEK